MSDHPSYERLVEGLNARLDAEKRPDGPSDIARLLTESPQTVGNWRRRGVPPAVATRVQELFGINASWIVGISDDMDPPGQGDASRAVRLSAPTVVNATQALRTFLGRRGIEYDPIDHAVLFVKVYEEADKLSEQPSQQQLVAFASAVADIVQIHVGGGSQ